MQKLTLENKQNNIHAIPRVRLLAKQMGIDLSMVRPTGSQGQIQRKI